MRVQHNISAINAHRNLMGNNTRVGKNLEKLSSGYRVNRAGDDAAGLAISEKMRAQISCLTQAETNCNDGISLIQTAEGALTEVHSMLNRMVELSEQSANGVYDNETDRKNLQAELDELKSEVNRISDATNFNGINLLDGTLGGYATDFSKTANTLDLKVSGGQFTTDGSFSFTTTAAGGVTLSGIETGLKDSAGNAISFADETEWKKVGLTANNSTVKNADGTFTTTVKFSFNEADIDPTAYDNTGAGKMVEEAKELANALNGATFTINIKGAESTAKLVNIGKGVVDAQGNPVMGPDGVTQLEELGNGLTLQIGDTSDAFNQLTVSVNNMDTKSLGIDTASIATQEGAAEAVKSIKDAINSVSSTRGQLGAWQNRLEHTVNNLSVTNENMTAAESRIRDTDMAKEMMQYTKNNILSQAAQSMLAQANQQPQQVLSLLQ